MHAVGRGYLLLQLMPCSEAAPCVQVKGDILLEPGPACTQAAMCLQFVLPLALRQQCA